MQPMRSAFGRGGPLTPRTAAAKLAIALIVGSVIAALAGELGFLLRLTPLRVVYDFALWQPITYTFIETQPIGVIFGALIIWMIGGPLEMSWGARRMLSFAIGSTVLSGVLTTLIGLLWPGVGGYTFAGGTVLTTVLWVAYGLAHSRAQVNFWGLPLSGNGLAMIGIGFVALQAVFARSLVPVMPEVFGILLTFGYVKVGSPRILLLKLKRAKYERELRSRSKHLRVVSKDDRNTGTGSDRYLH